MVNDVLQFMVVLAVLIMGFASGFMVRLPVLSRSAFSRRLSILLFLNRVLARVTHDVIMGGKGTLSFTRRPTCFLCIGAKCR